MAPFCFVLVRIDLLRKRSEAESGSHTQPEDRQARLSGAGREYLRQRRNSSLFLRFREVGIPLCEALGDGGKLACDGNFAPLLILFPKMCIFGNLCSVKEIDLFIVLWYNLSVVVL